MIADPLNIGETSKENIAWFRHAEIKHGRVAMIAFVGHVVQATGAHWPWALTTSGVTHADISAAGGPADQWDALPSASKLQILICVGFLEVRATQPPPPPPQTPIRAGPLPQAVGSSGKRVALYHSGAVHVQRYRRRRR